MDGSDESTLRNVALRILFSKSLHSGGNCLIRIGRNDVHGNDNLAIDRFKVAARQLSYSISQNSVEERGVSTHVVLVWRAIAI